MIGSPQQVLNQIHRVVISASGDHSLEIKVIGDTSEGDSPEKLELNYELPIRQLGQGAARYYRYPQTVTFDPKEFNSSLNAMCAMLGKIKAVEQVEMSGCQGASVVRARIIIDDLSVVEHYKQTRSIAA